MPRYAHIFTDEVKDKVLQFSTTLPEAELMAGDSTAVSEWCKSIPQMTTRVLRAWCNNNRKLITQSRKRKRQNDDVSDQKSPPPDQKSPPPTSIVALAEQQTAADAHRAKVAAEVAALRRLLAAKDAALAQARTDAESALAAALKANAELEKEKGLLTTRAAELDGQLEVMQKASTL